MAVISPSFVTIFDTEVKHAYQGARKLAGLVREKSVTGDTVKFNKLSKGIIGPHTSNRGDADVLSYSLVTANMVNYIASEYAMCSISHLLVSQTARNSPPPSKQLAVGWIRSSSRLDAATSIAVANTIAEDGTTGSAWHEHRQDPRSKSRVG